MSSKAARALETHAMCPTLETSLHVQIVPSTQQVTGNNHANIEAYNQGQNLHN